MANQNDAIKLYIKDIYNIPRLDREQEKQLAIRVRAGDQEARNILVSSHLRFVVSIAKTYHCSGMELSDLISEGNLGLLRAIETFDHERGVFFLSYAVWWIRQSIMKAIQQKSRLIRLPLHRVAELSLIEKTQNQLRKRLGDEPDLYTLAATLNMNPEHIKSLLSIARELTSLDCEMETEQESGSLVDFIASKHEVPEEHLMRISLKENIERMLAHLSQREADILRSRFGLNNLKPLSLRSLAERYKVTKERIRQIEKKALQALRSGDNWKFFDGYQSAA